MADEIKTRVLLVEDDVNLGTLLREYLNAKGFSTDLCPNGEEGFKSFKKEHYDICVLDVMMPIKDGFSLAKDIRTINTDIPIIFLTAKSMKEDVLEGFELGADDYITKPFNMQELLYRIEAVMRRAVNTTPEPDTYVLGKYTFDPNRQVLVSEGKEVSLTTKESELLKLLCQYANKILERDLALKTVWSDDNYFNARSMDVYITKLRKHLKSEPVKIMNIHGKGYKLLTNIETE